MLSHVLALACNTRSTVISALRPSTVNCWSPSFLIYSILFLVLLSSLPDPCIPPHNASAVLFCHSSLFFSKILVDVSLCNKFFGAFLLPSAKLHLTKLSARAFLACFLSALLLIVFVHLAAASSLVLISSGVLCRKFSLGFGAMRNCTWGEFNPFVL